MNKYMDRLSVRMFVVLLIFAEQPTSRLFRTYITERYHRIVCMFTALNWNILYGDLNIFRSVLPISPYEYEIYKHRRFEIEFNNDFSV